MSAQTAAARCCLAARYGPVRRRALRCGATPHEAAAATDRPTCHFNQRRLRCRSTCAPRRPDGSKPVRTRRKQHRQRYPAAASASHHPIDGNASCPWERPNHAPELPVPRPVATIPIANRTRGSVQSGFNEVALRARPSAGVARPHRTLQIHKEEFLLPRRMAGAGDSTKAL
jgi:hypothetical protein